MAKNMLAHEHESMEMAQKLTLMKNQIMENDAAHGMMKRHPAVRLGRIRHHPCTVSNTHMPLRLTTWLTLSYLSDGIRERRRRRLLHGCRWTFRDGDHQLQQYRPILRKWRHRKASAGLSHPSRAYPDQSKRRGYGAEDGWVWVRRERLDTQNIRGHSEQNDGHCWWP